MQLAQLLRRPTTWPTARGESKPERRSGKIIIAVRRSG